MKLKSVVFVEEAAIGCFLGLVVFRVFCALWDGNGPHNQLDLRITAALWVPLQSHPLKQALRPCRVRSGLFLN